ncbi:MAG: hypothetical protein J6V49_03030 [Bacteroidales bacterium]|nr:hypothetical protein [Bacteroidales bacterium]MBO5819200.1 hypothetical protein [Bacteroidales bacterium]MBO5835317.1 hypothetical protein [Bacteroidales bacterium]MBO5847133.1 hypothetical protein [Bacteroidales bacterium]MBO5915778.1 hypothetical protein [Bacteroidales bacterium]
MKKFFVVFSVMMLSFTAFAQKGVEDGSKYGHGEDSVRCIQNLSLYQTYAKQGDYATALEFWTIAYTECPAASINLYIEGAKIRTWQLKREKDPAKKMEYFNALMQVYDQRIQYFGDYVRAPRPFVYGRKAVDYFTLHPDGENSDKKPAYEWLTICINECSVRQFNAAYAPYFILASKAMLENPEHKTQFINDYLKVMDVMDQKIALAKTDAEKEKLAAYESDINDVFVSSGVADCTTLQEIFAADLEANKTNLEWLNKVVDLFKRVKCTDTEVYFAASQYSHQLNPTPESAEGCAYMCIKKEEYSKAAEYLNEAIAMTDDNNKKSEYEFLAATALFAGKQYAEARKHALAAASYKEGYAEPYVMIAKMYANSVDQFDDQVIRRLVYCAAVDKLEKAKSIDPAVAEECNDLIAKYKEQYPRSEDVFMNPNVDEGKPYTLGGWINERTIVRVKR